MSHVVAAENIHIMFKNADVPHVDLVKPQNYEHITGQKNINKKPSNTHFF